MTITDTRTTTLAQYAAATAALSAFLAAHPDLPAPTWIGVSAEDDAVNLRPAYGQPGHHDGTEDEIEAIVTVWAAALAADPAKPFTHSYRGSDSVMHSVMADITPGVRVELLLTAALESAEPAAGAQ